MSKKLIVLSQENCRPCTFVKNFLSNEDVPFETLDVQVNKEYIDKYNIMSTPVTILLDSEGNEMDRVSGFNPPLLNGLIEQL